MKLKAQVEKSTLRTIIERVTELIIDLEDGKKRRVYAIQIIGSDGRSYGDRIQNWECDNITAEFTFQETEDMFRYCDLHWTKLQTIS